MRLPWVSRLAFEIVNEDRRRLQEQNDHLVDALVRLERRKHGMPEQPRTKPAPEPAPAAVREYVAGYESRAVRSMVEAQLLRRHTSGTPWSMIVDEIKERTHATQDQAGRDDAQDGEGGPPETGDPGP